MRTNSEMIIKAMKHQEALLEKVLKKLGHDKIRSIKYNGQFVPAWYSGKLFFRVELLGSLNHFFPYLENDEHLRKKVNNMRTMNDQDAMDYVCDVPGLSALKDYGQTIANSVNIGIMPQEGNLIIPHAYPTCPMRIEDVHIGEFPSGESHIFPVYTYIIEIS